MMLPASNRSQTEPSIARIEAFVECQTTKIRPNYDQVGTVNSRNCVEAESRLTRFAVNTSPSPLRMGFGQLRHVRAFAHPLPASS